MTRLRALALTLALLQLVGCPKLQRDKEESAPTSDAAHVPGSPPVSNSVAGLVEGLRKCDVTPGVPLQTNVSSCPVVAELVKRGSEVLKPLLREYVNQPFAEQLELYFVAANTQALEPLVLLWGDDRFFKDLGSTRAAQLVRLQIVRALTAIGDARALPILYKAAQGNSWRHICAALDGLALLAPKVNPLELTTMHTLAQKYRGHLMCSEHAKRLDKARSQALGSRGQTDYRIQLAKKLTAKLSADSEAVLKKLRDHLLQQDAKLLTRAAILKSSQALLRLGHIVIPGIVSFAIDKDPRMRRAALVLLSQYRAIAIDGAVSPLLADKDATVRAIAAEVLGYNRPPHNAGLLFAQLKQEKDTAVRRAAVLAIGWQLERLGESTFGTMIDAEQSPPVIRAYLSILGRRRATWSVGRVGAYTSHREELVRRDAVLALAQLRAKNSVPLLIKRLSDKSQQVKLSAKFALERLTGEKSLGADPLRWLNWWREHTKKRPKTK